MFQATFKLFVKVHYPPGSVLQYVVYYTSDDFL